MDFIDLSFD